jgi:hypothetical protein
MALPPTTVRLFLVPRHSGIHGNYIADWLTREENVHQFVGPKPLPPTSYLKTGTDPVFRLPIYLFFGILYAGQNPKDKLP